MSGSPFGILEAWGAHEQTAATKDAARKARDAAMAQVQAQKEFFNKMMELHQPYHEVGLGGIEELDGADPTGGAGRYMEQLEGMEGLQLPELNLDSFSYAFDPNDPTYQYRKQEMEKTINEQAAARGNYNSRAAINALMEGNMGLTADESERQFGRALQTYGTNRDTALQEYSADYGRSADLYNQQRGNVVDLYNMAMQTGSADYNAIIDKLKVGRGSAVAAGQGAIDTGQGISNVYGNLGNMLSQLALERGNIWSNWASGMGANMGNTANTIGYYMNWF